MRAVSARGSSGIGNRRDVLLGNSTTVAVVATSAVSLQARRWDAGDGRRRKDQKRHDHRSHRLLLPTAFHLVSLTVLRTTSLNSIDLTYR